MGGCATPLARCSSSWVRESAAGQERAHRSQIELITGVCSTVDEAVGQLSALRSAVLDTGVGLIASGTHPTAVEGDSQTTANPRYERIQDLLGDAGATPICALHILGGMPDAATAIRVFNGLRRHLPLLEALAANSPFRHGRDTGLASSRALTLRAWPRAGVPRAMADFDDFVRSTARLTAVAEVPDYTYHWWKLRPHPRLGTVEIRALDTQPAARYTRALVALVHALARYEASAEPANRPPAEMADEACFRAARAGVDATLPDSEDRIRPVRELVEETLGLVRPAARELDCDSCLDGIGELLVDGGGAGCSALRARGQTSTPCCSGCLPAPATWEHPSALSHDEASPRSVTRSATPGPVCATAAGVAR